MFLRKPSTETALLLPFSLFSSLTNRVVAVKEIRINQEEGLPFTAIREGKIALLVPVVNSHCSKLQLQR